MPLSPIPEDDDHLFHSYECARKPRRECICDGAGDLDEPEEEVEPAYCGDLWSPEARS